MSSILEAKYSEDLSRAKIFLLSRRPIDFRNNINEQLQILLYEPYNLKCSIRDLHSRFEHRSQIDL